MTACTATSPAQRATSFPLPPAGERPVADIASLEERSVSVLVVETVMMVGVQQVIITHQMRECNYALNNGPDGVQYLVFMILQAICRHHQDLFFFFLFNILIFSPIALKVPSHHYHLMVEKNCFQMSLIISHLSYTGCDVGVK